MTNLEICDRSCLYKNKDNSCKMRLKKGVERARKSGSCKMYKNATKTFNSNKASCEMNE